MKLLYAVFIILLNFFSINAQIPVSYGDELSHPELFGQRVNLVSDIKSAKVNSESIYYYNVQKRTNKDSLLSVVRHYDSTGAILSEEIYTGKNIILSVSKFYYTDLGDIDKIVLKYPSGSEKNTIITKFEYDSLGEEISKYVFNNDTSSLTIEQKFYDEKGQLIELQRKYNNNNYYIDSQYSYDSFGRLVKKEKVATAFPETLFYEYDNASKKILVYTLSKKTKILVAEYFMNERLKIDRIDGKQMLVSKEVSIKNNEFENERIATGKRVIYFTYNSDGTLFQITQYLNDELELMSRRFYTKY